MLGLFGIRVLTEGGTNLEGQLLQGIGFLQEISFKIDHFVIEHCLSGIAGNEEELGIRPQLRKCRVENRRSNGSLPVGV